MGPRATAVLLIVLLVSVGGVVDAAVPASDGPVRQADGGMDGRGDGGDGGMDGGHDGGTDGGPDDGRANVSVDHRRPGNASVRIRDAAADDTIRVRFRRAVGSPETGIQVREMAMRTRGGNVTLGVRVAARASAGVAEFPHGPTFGYLNVTHSVPNANVTNASLTFALDRTRLRERNVSAGDVRLYRYRETNRTWRRLETRVTARNESQVTYRAASPGLSEFAVAATGETATSTPTETPDRTEATTPTGAPGPTATSTAEATSTAGDGAGFGIVAVAVAVALSAAVLLATRRR